jgi:hypothetical protein
MPTVRQCIGWRRIVCIVVLAACVHINPTTFAKPPSLDLNRFIPVNLIDVQHPIMRAIVESSVRATLLFLNTSTPKKTAIAGAIVAVIVLYHECNTHGTPKWCSHTLKNFGRLEKHVSSNQFSLSVQKMLVALRMDVALEKVVFREARKKQFIRAITLIGNSHGFLSGLLDYFNTLDRKWSQAVLKEKNNPAFVRVITSIEKNRDFLRSVMNYVRKKLT